MGCCFTGEAAFGEVHRRVEQHPRALRALTRQREHADLERRVRLQDVRDRVDAGSDHHRRLARVEKAVGGGGAGGRRRRLEAARALHVLDQRERTLPARRAPERDLSRRSASRSSSGRPCRRCSRRAPCRGSPRSRRRRPPSPPARRPRPRSGCSWRNCDHVVGGGTPSRAKRPCCRSRSRPS